MVFGLHFVFGMVYLVFGKLYLTFVMLYFINQSKVAQTKQSNSTLRERTSFKSAFECLKEVATVHFYSGPVVFHPSSHS